MIGAKRLPSLISPLCIIRCSLVVIGLLLELPGEILPPARAESAQYYVSSDGSDLNDGLSLKSALRTIQKCADVAVAGDTCLIRGGVYRETVTVPASGEEGMPITFKNYDGEDVTISGADLVTGWTLHSGRIYSAPTGWSLNVRSFSPQIQVTGDQLFVDGQMMVEARWPNIPVDKVTRVTNADKARATGATLLSTTSAKYSDPALNVFPADYWRGAKINFGPGFQNVQTTCDVTASEAGSFTFQCNPDRAANNARTQWTLPPSRDRSYRPHEGNYYYLWGKLAALDAPGEWYRDGTPADGTLYLWMPDGSDPNASKVEAKSRLWAFDLGGKSYITIDGLKFFAATLRTGDYDNFANHITVQNVEARYLWHFQEIPPVWREDGIHALDFGGTDNVLRDSYLAYSAGPLVRLYGKRNLAYNNVLRDGAYMGNTPLATGFFSDLESPGGADKNTLMQNTLFDSGMILVGASAGLDITFNDMYNSHLQISDLGEIYAAHTDGKDAEIAYNMVHANHAELDDALTYWGGFGIYLDNDTANYTVHHNIVWDTSLYGLYAMSVSAAKFPNGSNRKFYNNTVDGRIVAGLRSDDDTLRGTEFRNNYGTAAGLGHSALIRENNCVEYELGVKERGQDYSLRPDSPAIDAGVVIPGYTDGYIGSAPDAGAYEFGRPAFVSGAVLRQADVGALTTACSVRPADRAWCTVGNLPLGRKLPIDFMLRVGTSGTPAQTCTTRMNYETHAGTGTCNAVPLAGLAGVQTVYVKLGDAEWQATGGALDLGTPAGGASISGTGETTAALPDQGIGSPLASYMRRITVSNSSGAALYNYQTLVTLDTAALVSQGKLRPDCGDLRFNDASGNLDYWLEDGCNTPHTRVWVKIPAIPIGASEIALSYGASRRPSASNGVRTFAFFDDFATGQMDNSYWRVDDGAWYTVENREGGLCLSGKTNTNTLYSSAGFGLDMRSLVLPTSYAIDSELTLNRSSATFKVAAGSADLELYGGGSGTAKDIGYYSEGGWHSVGTSTITTAKLNRQKLSMAYAGPTGDQTVRWLENGNLTEVLASRAVSGSASGHFAYSADSLATFDVCFSRIRVRSYAFPEPTVSLGVEEAFVSP